MLNAEKYKKEILKQVETSNFGVNKENNKIVPCRRKECNHCKLSLISEYCSYARTIWMLSEYKEPILDKKEKEYLEAVLKPFKNRVKSLTKKALSRDYEFILIIFKDGGEYLNLPNFRKDTMYKGMEVDKEYTLKELRLFESER